MELPTKLFYIGDPDNLNYDLNILYLDYVTQIDRGKYIALSHYWGELLIENKKQFCIT